MSDPNPGPSAPLQPLYDLGITNVHCGNADHPPRPVAPFGSDRPVVEPPRAVEAVVEHAALGVSVPRDAVISADFIPTFPAPRGPIEYKRAGEEWQVQAMLDEIDQLRHLTDRYERLRERFEPKGTGYKSPDGNVVLPVPPQAVGTLFVCDVCDRGFVIRTSVRTDEPIGPHVIRPEGWWARRQRRKAASGAPRHWEAPSGHED